MYKFTKEEMPERFLPCQDQFEQIQILFEEHAVVPFQKLRQTFLGYYKEYLESFDPYANEAANRADR